MNSKICDVQLLTRLAHPTQASLDKRGHFFEACKAGTGHPNASVSFGYDNHFRVTSIGVDSEVPAPYSYDQDGYITNAAGTTAAATTGGSRGPREQIDMAGGGGEQQLTGAQIDSTVDKVMPSIRRCFFLLEGPMPTDGVLRFGLRIESSGEVSRSNLTGPSAMVEGEPGRCLRKAAEGAPFPSFDGPAMQINYPVRLE